MTSMFKSVLSSISGYPKFLEQTNEQENDEDYQQQHDDDDEQYDLTVTSDDDNDHFVECPSSLDLPKVISASTNGWRQNGNNNNTSIQQPNATTTDDIIKSSVVAEKSIAAAGVGVGVVNNKQSISKKSKKTLSAMMGKLTNGKSASKKAAAKQEQQNGFNTKTTISEPNNNRNIDTKLLDKLAIKEEEASKGSVSSSAPLNAVDGQSGASKSGKSKSGGAKKGKNNDNDDDEDEGKSAFLLPEEECDIPTFLHTKNCDQHLIDETRILLKERYQKNPDSFYDLDYKRMLEDDWTVSRFLLRRRLDPKRTAKLMEECGRFRKQYKMSEVKLWEFPREFHQSGGLFKYAPDRVGNMTLYMRVKMYRRVPEISDVFKAWILCILEECDIENNGRGTAVIFDLTGCGLQNVDLGFLSWLLSSFRNYCPKGVSYILVYNLPWILNATCKLAMTWMSASNRRALRFVHGDEIENFISRENLPDYCGGTCKMNYKAIPEGSLPAIEVCDRLDMTREQALKIRELFKDYLDDDDDEDNENYDD